MIFVFIMRIIDRWYHAILFPVLMNILMYLLFGLWVGLMLGMTYLFLRKVNKARLYYMQKKVAISIVKSGLYGLLISTLLLAFVGLSVAYMAESHFFMKQRAFLHTLNILLMPHITGLNHVFHGIVILFLLISQYYVIEYVSDLSYQLQYPKKWWIYFVLSTCVSLVCYMLFLGLGYISN